MLLLSFVTFALWLFEILFSKGWYSLQWLSGTLYSPYLTTFIVVLAFLMPFMVSKQVAGKKLLLSAGILYTVSIFCYEAGKQLCYSLYCRFCFWSLKDIILLFSVALVLFVLIGFVFWFVAHKFIKRSKKINIVYMCLLALAVIPLSLFTIRVNKGMGHGVDWVDTVKMGYPVFWITLLMGVSGILMAKQKPIP